MEILNFQLAGATIPGWEHTQKRNVLKGINNHDAFRKHRSKDLMIAIVCDGCGSQPFSEVGSNDGADLILSALQRHWLRYQENAGRSNWERLLPAWLEAARQDLIASLRVKINFSIPLIPESGSRLSRSEYIRERYLFTIVGMLATPFGAAFFSIGDGVFIINGEVKQLGPFPMNEPPYVGYALFENRWKPEELQFTVHRQMPLEELQSFLIGSDGVLELASLADQSIPGSDELIGPISQFWEQAKYLTTRTGIRKRLARINCAHWSLRDGKLVYDNPRLHDDTTFVVGAVCSKDSLSEGGDPE